MGKRDVGAPTEPDQGHAAILQVAEELRTALWGVSRLKCWLGHLGQSQRDAERSGGEAKDPETGNDLDLRPAAELEMVVKRCHLKQASAVGQPEIPDLEDHRQQLGDEQDADHEEQKRPMSLKGD